MLQREQHDDFKNLYRDIPVCCTLTLYLLSSIHHYDVYITYNIHLVQYCSVFMILPLCFRSDSIGVHEHTGFRLNIFHSVRDICDGCFTGRQRWQTTQLLFCFCKNNKLNIFNNNNIYSYSCDDGVLVRKIYIV